MSNLADWSCVQDAWKRWLAVTRERCHLHFKLEGDDLATHLTVCGASAGQTAARVARDIEGSSPNTILEVGCSVGFNCLALAERFPSAHVVGIEPDVDAARVAAAMASARDANRVQFIHGVGEALPFKLETFDLIVCHTVIEHVQSVPRVIAEMARVLSRRGVIHLEAPNYRWPREPHLGIWCVPILGKKWMKVSAALQGKRNHLYYLDHLQLVNPNWLERLFRDNGLIWENRVRRKILRAASGEKDLVKEYHGMGVALRFVNTLGVVPAIANAVIGTGVYPSVLYTARRQESPP